MVVACQGHVEAQGAGYVVGVEHVGLGTLVHGNVCLLEPTLLLQVSLEGGQEGRPQFAVLLCAGGCLQELV